MLLIKRIVSQVCFWTILATLLNAPVTIAAAESPHDWLTGIFLTSNDCEPTSHLYFDPATKRSFNSILEKRGYVLRKNQEWITTYLAPSAERFVGLPVIDFSIPNAEMSVYSIRIAQPPQILAAAIKKATGKVVPILHGEPSTNSGKAYIVGEAPGQSTFVCFSFEEGM